MPNLRVSCTIIIQDTCLIFWNTSPTIHRDLKRAGSRDPKLTLFFSGGSSVSTLHRHIASMAGSHWEAYRSHCFDKKIMPNETAVPSVVKLEKDGKFVANEYVYTCVD